MFEFRLKHLRILCQQTKVDGFLVSSTSNIFYLSGFNRFLVDHDGFLLVTPTNVFLITSPLYTHAVKQYSPDLALLETTPDMWYAQHIANVMAKEHLTTLGFEEEDLRVAEYFDLQSQNITLKSVSLRSLRIEKDKSEVDAIQKACKLTDEAFVHVVSFVKEGITEQQLADEMEHYITTHGGQVGFPSIVAFGIHSAVPHHMTSDAKLEKNMFVLFDFGARVDTYLSDMSRTIFFGNPTDTQKKLYETVLLSQKQAASYIEKELQKGSPIKVPASQADDTARIVIKKNNFSIYPHSLGHGVGLDVHEAPSLSHVSRDTLTEGMVFTIEPGIYQPESGGVRIEDVFTILQGKLVQLTHAPKELIVI